MSITFACTNPKCKKALKAKDELAGKKLKCSGCGTVVSVPKEEGVQAGGPAPAKAGASPAKAGVAKGEPPPKQAAKKPAASKPAPPPADLSDLEQQWLASPLLKKNQYQICLKVLQLGFNKLGPSFDLCPPGSKDVLGETHYRHTWTTMLLKLFNLHTFVPHWIEVLDNDSTLFWMKVVSVVNNRYDIYDPDRGELLASLKTLFSLKLWLRVLDPQGEDVGELVDGDLPSPDGKTTYYGFNLKLNDGRIIGDITSNGNHTTRFKIKGAAWVNRGYVGVVAPEFVNDPRSKVLLLATTLVSFIEGFGKKVFNPMAAG
jgi:hypothetical protein